LYYRLNGLSLRLPPLRERREEIPILLRQFIANISEKFGRPAPPVSQRLIQACLAYPWPGNLRELQNFVKRYIVLRDEELAISELTGGMELGLSGPGPVSSPGQKLKSIVRNVKNGAEPLSRQAGSGKKLPLCWVSATRRCFTKCASSSCVLPPRANKITTLRFFSDYGRVRLQSCRTAGR
jgi:DNA-binding NtrC family response regulator